MITLENRFFPLRIAVCVLAEGGLIFLSVLLGFLLLERVDGGGHEFTLGAVALQAALVSFFCQSCMYLLDLYDLRHSNSIAEVFFSLLYAIGVVCIGVGLAVYAFPDLGVSLEGYYLTILLSGALLFAWRIGFNAFLSWRSIRCPVLVVGTGSAALALAREIRDRERLGFELAGLVGPPVDQASQDPDAPFPVLGDYGDLLPVALARKVWKIVVAINDRRGLYPLDGLLALKVRGYRILEWPSFFERLSGRILVENLAPSWFIFNEGFRKSPVTLVARRGVSFLVSVVLLLLLAPVMLLVALAVRLESPGPILYRQERVGKDGKTFQILKFRSMRQDAEAGGARWAVANDPRITRIGKYLRISRLDELPQLFNVLRGDLDLVGPRPERPNFVEELQKVIPYYALRHTVKPGLTGWAQVMFMYCGTIEESREKLQYDLFYIKNMSVKLDLVIIIKTVKIVLLGRGAR